MVFPSGTKHVRLLQFDPLPLIAYLQLHKSVVMCTEGFKNVGKGLACECSAVKEKAASNG